MFSVVLRSVRHAFILELLGFRLLETEKHNVPETGFISVLREREDAYSVGLFRKS
jgi:hypothetical protein